MFTSMFAFRLLRQRCLLSRVSVARNKYIVLLPEVPPDTPENNPLLRTNVLPAFQQITAQNCFNAIGKLIVEYECGIQKLDNKLSDLAVPKTVQNVILPLDQLSVPIDFAWASFKMLHTLGCNKEISEVFIRLHPRIKQAKREPFMSRNIYKAFMELNSGKQLAEPVRRVVKKYILESRLSGMDLPQDKYEQYQKIVFKLHKHKQNYSTKLSLCASKFSQPLTMSDVKNFPKDFLCQIAENKSNILNGPWKITMHADVYQRFMELCENRTLRWNVWNAKHQLASSISGQELNNSIEIEEIRFNKKEQANILGYESFADMSMETKMAGSIENVMALVTTLHVKSREAVLKEVQELQDFAVQQGFKYSLELWDVPFWQKKHREHLFKIDQEMVRQYFPLTTVLRGLFQFCHKLFGISVIESASQVEKWHEDVVYYKIFDENEIPVASFYLDPYARPSQKKAGAWMEVGRNRSDVVGSEPLSYLMFNFPPPQAGKPSLLSFKEVITLLQKFGHVLQHSLTTAPYSDVAGLTNLEWDVVNVCPMFMSQWLFHYDTIASLSGHVETGEHLPLHLHQQLIDDHNYMQNFRLNNELYLSTVDMELYGKRKGFWLDILKECWPLFMPFPFSKGEAHLCSFPQIFCDELSAAYYSSLWSEMIATDIFSAFEEVGLNNAEQVSLLGKRFKKYFLSAGGASHPSETFRQFRGRDPSTDAIVARYALNDVVLKQLEN